MSETGNTAWFAFGPDLSTVRHPAAGAGKPDGVCPRAKVCGQTRQDPVWSREDTKKL